MNRITKFAAVLLLVGWASVAEATRPVVLARPAFVAPVRTAVAQGVLIRQQARANRLAALQLQQLRLQQLQAVQLSQFQTLGVHGLGVASFGSPTLFVAPSRAVGFGICR